MLKMFTNLIEEAHREGLKEIVVEAIIQKEEKKILLIEDLKLVKPIYSFPAARVKEGEGLSLALQRAVVENTNMEIKKVVRYVGHYDLNNARHYHFVVEVNNPYALEENTSIAYAWLDVQEAVGYPVQDKVREVLDLYNKS